MPEEHEKARLCLVSDRSRLGFLFYKFRERTRTSFYFQTFGSEERPQAVVEDVEYSFCPQFIQGKIFALTDCGAPNLRVIEVRPAGQGNAQWIDIVPEAEDRIGDWLVVGQRLFVSYTRRMIKRVLIFDLDGQKTEKCLFTRKKQLVSSTARATVMSYFSKRSASPNPLAFIDILSPPERESFGRNERYLSIPLTTPKSKCTTRPGTESKFRCFSWGAGTLAEGTHPTIMTSYRRSRRLNDAAVQRFRSVPR